MFRRWGPSHPGTVSNTQGLSGAPGVERLSIPLVLRVPDPPERVARIRVCLPDGLDHPSSGVEVSPGDAAGALCVCWGWGDSASTLALFQVTSEGQGKTGTT